MYIHVLMRDEKEGRKEAIKQQGKDKVTHVYPQEILPWIILCMICECQQCLDEIIDDIINDIINDIISYLHYWDEYQCTLILFVFAVC